MNYKSELAINIGIKSLWNILDDRQLKVKWTTNFIQSELISGEEKAVDAVYKIQFLEKGKNIIMIEKIIASKPFAYKELQLESKGQMTSIIKYTLEELDLNTTKLICQTQTNFHNGLIAFLSPWMRKSMLKRQNQDLMKLKTVAESTN